MITNNNKKLNKLFYSNAEILRPPFQSRCGSLTHPRKCRNIRISGSLLRSLFAEKAKSSFESPYSNQSLTEGRKTCLENLNQTRCSEKEVCDRSNGKKQLKKGRQRSQPKMARYDGENALVSKIQAGNREK